MLSPGYDLPVHHRMSDLLETIAERRAVVSAAIEGRGRKKLEEVMTTMIVTEDGIGELVVDKTSSYFLVYNQDTEEFKRLESYTDEVERIKYVPPPRKSGITSLVLFPTRTEEYESEDALLREIQAFIYKWADVDDLYRKLASFYVLFTWVYDEFREVPYLRIIADLGSGKSRLGIDVLGRIVYKPIRTIAVSSMSALFRTIHMVRGTLVLDEADLGENSDKTADMVQLLNSGYKSDIPVMRVEKVKGTNSFMPEAFNVFGPKIIMSREQMKDHALESRCLPISMRETSRKDIPLMVTDDLIHESEVLRNKLLLWRFRNFGKKMKDIDPIFAQMKIMSRTKQLLSILSSVVSSDATKQELVQYANELWEELQAMRGTTVEAEICAAMRALINGGKKQSEYFFTTQAIIDRVNMLRPQGSDGRKPVTMVWGGRLIKSIFITKAARSGGGTDGVRGITITHDELLRVFTRFDVHAPQLHEQTEMLTVPDGMDPFEYADSLMH